jgi:cytochrome P450
MEVQRLACVAPSSLIHLASEDVEIAGYKVPKGMYDAQNVALELWT